MQTVRKALKFRLYPTQEQQLLIAKTFGCSRFVFNRFLDASQRGRFVRHEGCAI